MIDGFNWSALKTPPRATAAEKTIDKYNNQLRTWIKDHGGTVWATIGDCTIACGFPDIDEAVAAAMCVQRRLYQFNLHENDLDRALIVGSALQREICQTFLWRSAVKPQIQHLMK